MTHLFTRLYMVSIFLFSIAAITFGQVSSPVVTSLKIAVEDLDLTAAWYEDVLGMEKTRQSRKKSLLKMPNADFQLELIKSKKYMPVRGDHWPEEFRDIEGFFKIGFTVYAPFDAFESKLREKDVNLHGGMFFDQNLRRRSFLVKDPDGNRIQFFEASPFEEVPASRQFRANFLALMVRDIQSAIRWYESTFSFSVTHNLDIPRRDIFIKLLKSNGNWLELIEISDKTLSRNNFKKRFGKKAQGFIQMGWTSGKKSSGKKSTEKITDPEGNDFLVKSE